MKNRKVASKIMRDGVSIFLIGAPEILDRYGKMRWNIVDEDDECAVEIYMAHGFGKKELDFGNEVNRMIEKILNTREFRKLCHKRLNGKNGLHFSDVFLEILKNRDGWKDIIIENVYKTRDGQCSDSSFHDIVNWGGYVDGVVDETGRRVVFD